ncbi:MAG TPA: hypothetical protein VMS98_10130, partial [Thermoanaerobaculia bacterium]|nr:hypothetical protein [Thermoanaerobaculia bacterium]
FSDLLPAMGRQGIGSADLITRPGEAPESVIRIFNDAGARGTTGMSQDALAPEELLVEGMSAVLIAPIDPARSRFNIGVRTAASGAMLTVTQRDRSGAVLHGITRSYAPNYFEQLTAAAFLGRDTAADDSISIRVDAGSVVVYGATTDNLTQDPSLQLARPVDSVAGERRVLPVVGSTPGALGSFFKTAVQLHNATQQAIEGRLVFHPAGIRGGDHDPALPYHLAPGETISYDDLLPAMGLSGLGSVDLVSTTGPLPLSVTRIYNDAGDAGTTGMTEEQVPLASALRGGDRGVLLAPANPDGARFNIGIRTLDEGVTITFVVRNSIGREVGRTTRELAPAFFTQLPASTLLGLPPRENDSVTVIVESGAAIVYGTYTDNITQDPTLKVVRRGP